jgi:hypothetical protein
MLEGKRAEIEVLSLRLGDQVEAEWLPLLGIVYDPKDDIVEVALDGLDHMIRKPREIYVEDGAQGLLALEIVDADDVRQIIKLRDPLALPAPQRAYKRSLLVLASHPRDAVAAALNPAWHTAFLLVPTSNALTVVQRRRGRSNRTDALLRRHHGRSVILKSNPMT